MAADFRMKLFVKVEGKEDFDAICSALRGLFYSNGQSDGRTVTNKQFRDGVEIEFGGNPSLQSFRETVRKIIRRRVRERITLEVR